MKQGESIEHVKKGRCKQAGQSWHQQKWESKAGSVPTDGHYQHVTQETSHDGQQEDRCNYFKENDELCTQLTWPVHALTHAGSIALRQACEIRGGYSLVKTERFGCCNAHRGWRPKGSHPQNTVPTVTFGGVNIIVWGCSSACDTGTCHNQRSL